jgi:hypothetical protein
MTSLGTTSVPAIPDSRIAHDANDLIRSVESDLLYHHSLRVYSWGALQGALRGLRYDPNCSTSARCSTTSGRGASQRARPL